jgi:hypothetical protein
VADHQQTRTTESVYRRELRPVITIGAEIRELIFSVLSSNLIGVDGPILSGPILACHAPAAA